MVIFIATVDCTGHGIPEAFMSMIGNSLLNELIKQRHICEPKDILTQLNFEIKKSLKQEITENKDGMDVCLCRIDSNRTHSNLTHYKITFTGAKRPLFYYESNKKELFKLKGDRKCIGGNYQQANNINFTNQEIILQKDDLIYLTTDGYIDQNNKERKRFGTTKLTKILSEIANKPLAEQKQILETELDKWKRNEKQRDDITVIGIKL